MLHMYQRLKIFLLFLKILARLYGLYGRINCFSRKMVLYIKRKTVVMYCHFIAFLYNLNIVWPHLWIVIHCVLSFKKLMHSLLNCCPLILNIQEQTLNKRGENTTLHILFSIFCQQIEPDVERIRVDDFDRKSPSHDLYVFEKKIPESINCKYFNC